ncbi:beta-L-arabinofuranosidase domain-containing protein [Niabella drilacis]|uniref:DUF1680 family protein n=1 Tax=Niabella drilacis (strain DSM 25811 / CCM 8410 / CCUG 62505 / LMG 26954 / E90) TaxID=1285928 RepID=A0A1G6X2E4_NIADE|nr:beta-L-arabinofuranosidase domain-containing protein [Niabella drilacis]SDD71587.1 hypothetical protein SAMN04487894_11293 [Niabella drilacis]
MIRTIFLVTGLLAGIPGQARDKDSAQVTSLRLEGYLGQRIDQCITNRILSQDPDYLVEPFRHKNETSKWQSEFWGKWTLGACEAYRYNRSEALLRKIRQGAKALMKTQLSNGYIGNYRSSSYLAEWDVWGRKYSLLGLQAYYAITGDPAALEACKKMADHLLSQVGPGRANIATLGNYRGMAAGSVLEPVVYLYRNTRDQKYLDFANYIVRQWETETGPQLISKALNNTPVASRFLPVPKAAQWTQNGSKAYEMMSCYIGLLELYKIVGDQRFLAAAENTARQIMEQELTVAGNASANECFWHGAKNQTVAAFASNETCVTVTWMQFCERLYQLTGKSVYMDELEKTAYNALQASMKNDGRAIASYISLGGFRRSGERQCGMDMNCCEANGPRGFTALPGAALAVGKDLVTVNLYTDLDAAVALNKKNKIGIRVRTGYPKTGTVELAIDAGKPAGFTLALRIPGWSRTCTVYVNGEKINNPDISGNYARLNRSWKKGDRVKLELELEGRLVVLNNHVALVRGPVVLARDSRFNDGFVDASVAIEHSKDNRVVLTPGPDNGFAWMNFSVTALSGIYHDDPGFFRKIQFCDFGSAGNSWDPQDRYQVWLPRTIETADRDTWW